MPHLTDGFKYGLSGAGAVGATLIGRLPSKPSELGPVSAVSYRVASRIANTLRAGYAVRRAEDLNDVPNVLFHAPSSQVERLAGVLETARIDWKGKALVFCDCFVDRTIGQRFEAKGASVAMLRQFGIPGYLIAEGNAGKVAGAALHAVRRIARELHTKAVEITPGSADLFDAAVTLGSPAITPLIDQAAGLLRAAGIRNIEAARIVCLLFERTARDYARSGKQSWTWYLRKPAAERLEAQIAAAGHLGPVLRQLLLFGFETFRKHGEVVRELTQVAVRTRRHGQ